MKKIILILLIFTLGCNKQEESVAETEAVIINHGPLNKNITKVEGYAFTPFTANGIAVSNVAIRYNLQTLQYSATLYDGYGTTQCNLAKPIRASTYTQIRSAIDTVEVCTNSKVGACPLIYLPTDQFYLSSQSTLELEIEDINFPGCSSSKFACDTNVAKDLSAVTQNVIQTDLTTCP